MAKGIIYVMTTAVNNIIKIGRTETNQFKNRMKYLEDNGYRNIVGLKCFCAFELKDYDKKEKLLHAIFSKHKVPNSELFALDKELVKKLLLAFEGKMIYPPSTVPVTQAKTKNPPFNFYRRGLKNGDIIAFRANPSFTAKVVGEREVIYEGKRYKLTPLAFALYEKLGKPRTSALQGAYHFNFKNTRLTQLPIK